MGTAVAVQCTTLQQQQNRNFGTEVVEQLHDWRRGPTWEMFYQIRNTFPIVFILPFIILLVMNSLLISLIRFVCWLLLFFTKFLRTFNFIIQRQYQTSSLFWRQKTMATSAAGKPFNTYFKNARFNHCSVPTHKHRPCKSLFWVQTNKNARLSKMLFDVI